jgi:hypothetical protein
MYIPKKGTSYRSVVKRGKRLEKGAFEERIAAFAETIQKIDKDKSPSKATLKKDKKKYDTEYKAYLKALKEACQAELRWIGAGRKRTTGTARPMISALRKKLETIKYKNDLFLYMINDLKAKYPRQNEYLDALAAKEGAELSFAIKKSADQNIPPTLATKLAKLPHKHPAIQFLRLKPALAISYKKQAEKAARDKHKNPITIRIREVIATAEKYLSQMNEVRWFIVVASVCVLTGRRPIEVMKTGSFTKSDKPRHLTFYGQAKLHMRPDAPKNIPIVGSTPEKILEAIEWIRGKRDYTKRSNRQVNGGTAAQMNTYLRRYFNNEHIDVKTLRAIYAVTIDHDFYDEFGEGVSKPLYIAQALGHSPDDVKTQVRYAWLKPDWKTYEPYNPVTSKAQENAQKLSRLISIIEASMPAIEDLQKRGTAYEDLAKWLLDQLRSGVFVPKTAMERDQATRKSLRSRKTVTAFIDALKIPGGWPTSIEEFKVPSRSGADNKRPRHRS